MSSTRKQTIRWVSVCAASSALLTAAYGGASQSYAPRLAVALQLEAEPPCTLCHRTNDGGDGTVNSPFGRSVIEHGALGNNDLGSLDAALVSMHTQRTDSDGDAVADLVELQRGEDPNVPRPAPEPPDGEPPDGEPPDGEPPSEPPDGERPGGERPGGEPSGSGGGGTAGAPGTASVGGSVGAGHLGAASTTAQGAPQPSPPVLRTGCSLRGSAARTPWAAWCLGLAGLLQIRRLRRVCTARVRRHWVKRMPNACFNRKAAASV